MKVRVGRWAWMEGLSMEDITRLEKTLTIYPQPAPGFSKKTPAPIKLYRHGDNGMFGMARAFFLNKATQSHTIIDVTSDGSPMSQFDSLISMEGKRAEQKVAVASLLEYMEKAGLGGMILDAEPGTGKTVMSLQLAWMHGRTTLILVHKEFLMNQWVKRIKQFMPDARIGYIWQDRCDYENVDFVVGMIQSMTNGRNEKYPAEVYDAFGLVISDEVHRIGAETWGEVVHLFSARWRLGVSGTVRRKDGAEKVFYHHIGNVEYKFKGKSMVPTIKRVMVRTEYDYYMARAKNGHYYKVERSKMSPSQHINKLCSMRDRTDVVVEQIVKALKAKRKIMVLSERLEHLKIISELFVKAALKEEIPFRWRHDFYTGSWYTGQYKEVKIGKHLEEVEKTRSRSEAELEVAETANVVFATKQMVAEALDIPALDVLIIATPMSDVEQAVGRIRRQCVPNSECRRLCPWRSEECGGKPTPVVVDIIDKDITSMRKKWNVRAKFYVRIKAMEKAKMFLD